MTSTVFVSVVGSEGVMCTLSVLVTVRAGVAAGCSCFFRMWSTGTGWTNCGLWLFDDDEGNDWESPRTLDAGDSRLCNGEVVTVDLVETTGFNDEVSLFSLAPVLELEGTIFDCS